MANRFPLIANSSDSKIYELPSGDNLDLTGSGIYNGTATITLPTATSTLATLAGTETLTNKTINLASNTLVATSAQLLAAVTDETGTGSLVFATSPTLVTPNLGTPSAATLTNATGLPISTGVSGLGTGVATFLATPTSANLVAALTDETGTGSLYFTGGALGTPSSATLTNATGLPVSTGISGLGTGIATFLATPSSANLAAALTDETGSGSVVFSASPTFTGTANFAAVSTSGNATVGGDLTVTGNLIVNGTTTTINSTAVSVDDINIILGDTASPSNATADGGGITLKGATDKTLNWVNATGAWTSSEDFNLLTGKVYEIAGTSVLSATALGSGVVSSSLTSVGTIGTGTWQGTVIGSTYGGTGVNNGGRTITLNTGNLTLTAQAGGSSVTVPSSGTLVSSADTGTVTSTMIADGTIVNADINASAAIAVSKLAASTISGITLGNNLATLTIGTGLSGTSYNGSTAVTIANTGVTSIVAGTGISISGATGAVTITSSVPNASTQVSSLGVGTAASGTTGEIRATNAITSYYSDERLKKDITEIDGALDKVMQLKGVTFRANDLAESFGYSSDKEQVGVIAQDVEKVLPQIVVPAPFDRIQIQEGVEISRSGENYKTVHYEKIVPLLIQAIKEQQVMIEELKKKVGI